MGLHKVISALLVRRHFGLLSIISVLTNTNTKHKCMLILCRYKYIISHNILDHISILMARQYFGSVPIISVSPGHFSRTDMAASRDRDLVKMQEIRNTKFEPKILSLLSNRFQVGLRENPHGKIFQN